MREAFPKQFPSNSCPEGTGIKLDAICIFTFIDVNARSFSLLLFHLLSLSPKLYCALKLVNNCENTEYRVENITISAYVFLFLYLYYYICNIYCNI